MTPSLGGVITGQPRGGVGSSVTGIPVGSLVGSWTGPGHLQILSSIYMN